MEAQLTRLCIELEIPYRNNVNNTENLKRYDRFFDSYTSDHNLQLEDCECTTKRTLIIETGEYSKHSTNGDKERDAEFYLQQMFNMISNKCSLGQVTEYKGPNNSTDVLIGSMKQLSETSFRNSGDFQILSCFENEEFGNEYCEERFQNDVLIDAKDSDDGMYTIFLTNGDCKVLYMSFL